MKKFILLFLSISLFSTSIFAQEKLYSFIGIQSSATNFDGQTAPAIGLKYGKQSKNIRTSIAYSYAKKSSKTFQTVIVDVDTGIMAQTFKEIPFKPYLGASFGVIDANNDRGYLYGLNTGLSYVFNNNIDFDLGYRFLKTSKLKEMDKINDFIFSMHYFY